ncbi:ADC synthase [Mollisia scopiformis]|uniref:ADC synthase n=1 Tax=Mollisia scopiformis TaxID=149040 RepID=A0A194XVV2_MOLSC|nr:ADC synthase [Mollisia scopiformis]KUJ24445.1 ADC synthase [Mollisia scopiformis]
MDSDMGNLGFEPSLQIIQEIYHLSRNASKPPNLVPVCSTIPGELLTPSTVFLKLSAKSKSNFSFLFESAGTTEKTARYSLIGVIKTGSGFGAQTDPLDVLTDELSQYRVASIPSLEPSPLNGGAVGYLSYDCIKYFEPKTARTLEDNLNIPEALFMLFHTIVVFDHFRSVIKVFTYLQLPPLNSPPNAIRAAYDHAIETLKSTVSLILHPDIPLPHQPPISPNQVYNSNVGRRGYESHVSFLKENVKLGNIIQAVPLNPSPYLFYVSCSDFFLVGASPELLLKTDGLMPLPRFVGSQSIPGPLRPRIVNHVIAGTIARGQTTAEDEALAQQLLSSLKDRAEHVMLVDLARNDVNRVCDPLTVQVDRLMRIDQAGKAPGIDRFSHVQHLTSEVSGLLRPECSRWDALRSVFPAGTVSGAPKVRAMELISETEGETRGIYGGAVGWFGYDTVLLTPSPSRAGVIESEIVEEGPMDTCIAIRTMLAKAGVVYLQAGGGIVYDSNESEEWMETMNKLAANMRCIELAESRFGGNASYAKTVKELIEEERQKTKKL